MIAVALALGGGLLLFRLMASGLHPARVAEALRGLAAYSGPIAPLALIFMLAFVLVVPLLPAVIFQIGSGLAFGPGWGLVYVLLADLLGAALGFLLARRWGLPVLRRWMQPRNVARVERLARRMTWITVILLRLLPGPAYPLVSFAAGLSRLSLPRYLLASFAGVFPSLALLVLAGDIATGSPLLALGIVAALVGSLALVGRMLGAKGQD